MSNNHLIILGVVTYCIGVIWLLVSGWVDEE